MYRVRERNFLLFLLQNPSVRTGSLSLKEKSAHAAHPLACVFSLLATKEPDPAKVLNHSWESQAPATSPAYRANCSFPQPLRCNQIRLLNLPNMIIYWNKATDAESCPSTFVLLRSPREAGNRLVFLSSGSRRGQEGIRKYGGRAKVVRVFVCFSALVFLWA